MTDRAGDDGGPPQFLYKYREPDWPYLSDLVLGNRVWFSAVKDLNDPFDCRPIIEPMPEERRQEFIERLLQDPPHGIELSGEALEGARRRIEACCAGGREAEQALFGDDSGTGVFSLSANPASAVMWAAYGANHAGFALQFDIAALVDAADEERTRLPGIGAAELPWVPLQVSYSSNRPRVRASSLYGGDNPLIDLVCTKSDEWRHEEEWRCLASRGPGYRALPPQALVGIVFGLQPRLDLLLKVHGVLTHSGRELVTLQVQRGNEDEVAGGCGYELYLEECELEDLIRRASPLE